MSDTPIARHFLGIWTRVQRYLDPPKSTPMLVWRNVYEVNGQHYEAPNELCAPLEECTEEEREAAKGLPAWVPPPIDDAFTFTPEWARLMGDRTNG